jgi:hypothetical protein
MRLFCKLLCVCFILFVSQPTNLLAEDQVYVDNQSIQESISNTENVYKYTVKFNGDFDESNELAFDALIKDLSKGSMNPSELAVNIGDLIESEQINEDSLDVIFNSAAVNNLISKGSITVWNGLVDPVIVWLVKGVADEDSKIKNATIISSSMVDGFSQKLLLIGKENNISIIYPMMDLDDIQNVTVSDVLSSSIDKVLAASSKYTSGLILNAYLEESDNNFNKLTYKIINIANSSELFSDTIEGSEDDIISKLYLTIKMNMSEKLNLSESVDAAIISGFSYITNLKLGEYKDNHVRILVRNTENFKQMVDVKNNLLKCGFTHADIVDVKGGDAIYDLQFDKGIQYKLMIEMYEKLKFNNDFVYTVNNTKDVSSKNSEDIIKSNETDVDIQYNTDVSVTKDQNNTTDNSTYPDPNKKLRTGGGVIE